MFARARRIKTSFRKPPPRKPIPFLTELKSTSDPNAALDLLLNSHPSHHTYPACSSLLYRLARAHLFPQVSTLLYFIRSNHIPCKPSLFNALIDHYGKAHLPHEALRLFNSIPSFNCPPSLQTFNHLLNALVDNDCLYQAQSLLSQINTRPNAVSFNIILKGITMSRPKDGLELAHLVLDEMIKRRISPSVVTYNILIGFASRNGLLDKAMVLKEEMVRKGTHPNAATYALLMEGFCLKDNYREARKMMFDMEYQGCKTRVVNYGVLMSDRGRRGDFEEVRELLAEMKRRKMKPDGVIYSILINYLCVKERVDEAYKVLVDMQINGCEPSVAVYRMMVDGYCRAREFDKGLRVMSAMLSSGHCPRGDTLGCLISGLCEGGKVGDACFVLEEMQKRKMGLDVKIWGALVDAICVGCDGKIKLLSELTSMSFVGDGEEDASVE